MIGSKKKKVEGFEWHKYVRTTIKLRREARRDKAGQLKRAAAEGFRAAGDAAGDMAMEGARHFAAGAKAAGSMAGSAAVQGARSFAMWSTSGMHSLWLGMCRLAGAISSWLHTAGSATGRRLAQWARSDALSPLMDVLSRPAVSTPLAIAGGIALLAGAARAAVSFRLDRDTGIGLLLGLICLLLAYGPRALRGTAPALPTWLARISPPVRRGVAMASLAVVVGAIGWSFLPGRNALPTIGHLASFQLMGGSTIEGRASALSGDMLRVGHTLVRLAGIEAPEWEQRCLRPGNRRWRCAEAAREALARMAQGRKVTCEPKGADAVGRTKAICHVGKTDIAAELVKDGHVFAESGMLARYSHLERTAKSAKAGLWKGEAERPDQFRARSWEEAKRSAPDGCPIKGHAAGGTKVYVLPWSAEYARVRISKARGDRWFCSEQEAIAAGWRATERG